MTKKSILVLIGIVVIISVLVLLWMNRKALFPSYVKEEIGVEYRLPNGIPYVYKGLGLVDDLCFRRNQKATDYLYFDVGDINTAYDASKAICEQLYEGKDLKDVYVWFDYTRQLWIISPHFNGLLAGFQSMYTLDKMGRLEGSYIYRYER